MNRLDWPPELEGVATSRPSGTRRRIHSGARKCSSRLLDQVERRVKRIVEEGAASLVSTHSARTSLSSASGCAGKMATGVFEGIDRARRGTGAHRRRPACSARRSHRAGRWLSPALACRAGCAPELAMAHARELDWLRSPVGVLALDDRAIISVVGDDAREWLQGQLTNQLEARRDRTLGVRLRPHLEGADSGRRLRARSGRRASGSMSQRAGRRLLERLDRYIIMEDVDLEHRDGLRIMVRPRALGAAS